MVNIFSFLLPYLDSVVFFCVSVLLIVAFSPNTTILAFIRLKEIKNYERIYHKVLMREGVVSGLTILFFIWKLGAPSGNGYGYFSTIIAYIFVLVIGLGRIFFAARIRMVTSMLVQGYLFIGIALVFVDNLLQILIIWEAMAILGLIILIEARRWNYSLSYQEWFSYSLRYFIYHLIGGCLLMIGICSYYIHGITTVTELNSLNEHGWEYYVIMAGVLTNCGMVGLHPWITRVYHKTNPAITFFMSTITTKASLVLLIHIFSGETTLLYLGTLTAIFGVIMAIGCDNLRQLLAYHIVSQMGIMIASTGATFAEGSMAAFYHCINNILYKGLLFLIAGFFLYTFGSEKLSELKRYHIHSKLIKLSFFIAAMAISGVPLFSGFNSKYMVNHAIISSGHVGIEHLLVLATIGTWVSIACKIGYYLFIHNSEPLKVEKQKEKETKICDDFARVSNSAYDRYACDEEGRYDPYAADSLSRIMWQKTTDCNSVEAMIQKYCMIVMCFLIIACDIFPKWLLGAKIEVGNMLFSMEAIKYVVLFIGASIGFIFMKKFMNPHALRFLDMDNIYERAVVVPFLNLSNLLDKQLKQMEEFAISSMEALWHLIVGDGKFIPSLDGGKQLMESPNASRLVKVDVASNISSITDEAQIIKSMDKENIQNAQLFKRQVIAILGFILLIIVIVIFTI